MIIIIAYIKYRVFLFMYNNMLIDVGSEKNVLKQIQSRGLATNMEDADLIDCYLLHNTQCLYVSLGQVVTVDFIIHIQYGCPGISWTQAVHTDTLSQKIWITLKINIICDNVTVNTYHAIM